MQLFGRRALARYTALVLGLGAAGLAIGWIGHDLTADLTPSATTLQR